MERFPSMSDGNINISDVLAAIETTDPSFAEQNRADVEMLTGGNIVGGIGGAGGIGSGGGMETRSQSQAGANRTVPYVEIIEQPASKALRFRYECEGRSAGSIPGVNSIPENKTFPGIRIVGYKGRAIVVVSCVTKDPPYRPHPHNLVGKEVCKRGVCTVEISSENMTVSFDKLGIQCVKRKDIEEALRLREEIRVDPFRTGFDHKRQPTSIDLNAVRLCFQVFIEGQEKGKCTVALQPVVSEPIYDKKAMSDLVICKLSHCSASVAGGTEMVLLCEKVAKDDIQVRFYEERNGQTVWEATGDFQPTHVHKQVAIAFRTPKYKSQQIDQPVQVFIQLRRPSDGATSDALHFQLLPLGLGRPSQLWSLRKAFARKKAASEFARYAAIPRDQLPPRSPRVLDEFNNNISHNNNNNNDYGFDDLLEAKRTHGKLLALRALGDTYNAQKNDPKSSTSHELEMKPSVRIAAKIRSDWFDYSQVGKWVQKSQESRKESLPRDDSEPPIDGPTNNGTSPGDKSLDELLTQVVELDKIYEDTHAKLAQEQQLRTRADEEKGDELETPDVPDNQTYTSLQLAMKNPVWVRARKRYEKDDSLPLEGTTVSSPIISIAPDAPAPPRPPPPASRAKRDVTAESEEPLPPLPPKRIRKTPSMPVLPRAGSGQILTEQQQQRQVAAPHKTLPTPPNSGSLPKQPKPGLFSKLFSKRTKKDAGKDSPGFLSSTTSLPGLGKESSKLSTDKHLEPLDGDVTPPYGVELTEAEHYALYTAMAPHATASEFDEMSFYYSPVEGGKILVEGKENA